METIRSFFPKLDDFWLDAVATPSIWARRTFFAVERFGRLSHPLFEHGTSSDHVALVAGDSTQACSERP
jgi:hypothetical protein